MIQIVSAAFIANSRGRVGVVYQQEDTGDLYTWSLTNSAFVTAGSAAVQALVSGARNGPWGTDMSWLLPVHRQVLNGETLDPATITSSSGVVTASAVAVADEWHVESIRLTASGAVTDALITVPIPVDRLGNKPAWGHKTHLRIKCSDWSKVTTLWVSPYTGAVANRFDQYIVNAGKSEHGCTDPLYAAKWNDVYRTFILQGTRRDPKGTVPDWCGTTDDVGDFLVDGVYIKLAVSAAVTIDINRVYSPMWPIGFFTLTGDGAYRSFIDVMVPLFEANNWRGCVSRNISYTTPTDVYPSLSEIQALAARGWDVIPHFKTTTSLIGGSAFSGSESQSLLESNIQSQLAVLGGRQPGARFAQFLQDAGTSNDTGGVFMAAALRKYGLAGGRGNCVDNTFGINPFDSTYTERMTTMSTLSYLGGVRKYNSKFMGLMNGWVPDRGQFNYTNRQTYDLDATISGASAAEIVAEKDTYNPSLTWSDIQRAANYRDGTFKYSHQFLPRAQLDSADFNSGTQFAADMVADLKTLTGAGRMLVMRPSDLLNVTYLRPGNVYLRWDNEWVYRDGGAIAL